MPKDKAGKFHLSDQKARASDKASAPPKPNAVPPTVSQPPAGPTDSAGVGPTPCMVVYDNGDGTGYAETDDGARHEIADIESMKAGATQFFDDGGMDMQQPPMPAAPDAGPMPDLSGM